MSLILATFHIRYSIGIDHIRGEPNRLGTRMRDFSSNEFGLAAIRTRVDHHRRTAVR
jgi:hypothetical protein